MTANRSLSSRISDGTGSIEAHGNTGAVFDHQGGRASAIHIHAIVSTEEKQPSCSLVVVCSSTVSGLPAIYCDEIEKPAILGETEGRARIRAVNKTMARQIIGNVFAVNHQRVLSRHG